MNDSTYFDVVVVGGGPAGATAAADLAGRGRRVLLLDRAGRIKPCGGAVPPKLLREFDVPESLLVARARSARIVSPSIRCVEMPINEGGFVGMVDREHFDEWLRERAAARGAVRIAGAFEGISRDAQNRPLVQFRVNGETESREIRTRAIIGADGATSGVARSQVPAAKELARVYAYHEIVRAPAAGTVADYDGGRCEVHYRGEVSPDFYGWVFPHGDTISIGSGTAHKGFSLRGAVTRLREDTGLADAQVIRREGAPLPLQPLRCWDNGRDVVLAGDAAGVVAPASGEGIFYAMTGGRLAADSVEEFLHEGNPKALALARRRFMRAHGRVFWVLGLMQRFWYQTDKRRERFVSICRDPDVQALTWEAYLNKRLVRTRPLAHARIFFKDMAHLLGLVAP